MAVPGIKYDDESGGFASNCFPVRFSRAIDNGGGAWIVSHQAEQRRRFKAVLCANPLTYDQIKEQRRRSERGSRTQTQTIIIPPPSLDEEDFQEDNKILDGFFLMKHCCVEDPSDLCSVNVSGQELVDIKEEDLMLFDNVAYVNASDNLLPMEPFKSFPILRELEMSVNALRSIQINPGDFPHLEMLDVSFNNLSQADILTIGLLPALKILHLTGNGLSKLPENIAYPYISEDSKLKLPRYQKLEILLIEDNRLTDLSIFAALAGLPNLRHLSLSKNELSGVPQLLVLDGRLISRDLSAMDDRPCSKKSARSGRHTSRSSHKSSRKSNRSSLPKRNTPMKTPPASVNEGFSDSVTTDAVTSTEVNSENQGRTQQDKNYSSYMDEIKNVINEEDESESTNSEKGQDTLSSWPPPFPELVHLDLSYNKIYYEESLLAVAAWPALTELVIHNNPLTTDHTGDPPLLKTYLIQRLGIHIVRKKPGPLPKPQVEVMPMSPKQVSDVVPKVPRQDVEDVIKAIKAAIFPAIESPSPVQASPVQGSPRGLQTFAQKEVPKPHSPEPRQDGQAAADAFFMTQVEEQQEEKKVEQSSGAIPKKAAEDQMESAKKKTTKTRKQKRSKKEEHYDILYEDDATTEERDEMVIPHDVNSKVRALAQVLDHPLQYADEVSTLVEPLDFHPLYKKPSPPQKPRETKHDQVRRVLKNLKERPTIQEANLDDILQARPPSKKSYNEAARLLQEVQTKYNAVRTASMKEARQARDLSQEMQDQMQQQIAAVLQA